MKCELFFWTFELPIYRVLESAGQKFHLNSNEWNNGRKGGASVAVSNLARIVFAGNLLAIELDTARTADGVSFLSALAGIYPRDGRIGRAPRGQLSLDTFEARLRFIIRSVLTDLVDF
jgi:hypothetical protein